MNLIDIKMAGGFLEMDKASVRLNIDSNIFSNVAAPVAYSYPFSVPGTPYNKRLFGHTHLPESAVKLKQSYPVEIWLDGNYWHTCMLYVEEYKGGYFDVNVTSGGTLGNKELLDKKMREMDFGAYNAWDVAERYMYVLAEITWDDSEDLNMEIVLQYPEAPPTDDEITIPADPDKQLMVDNLMSILADKGALYHFTAVLYEPLSHPIPGTNRIVLYIRGTTYRSLMAGLTVSSGTINHILQHYTWPYASGISLEDGPYQTSTRWYVEGHMTQVSRGVTQNPYYIALYGQTKWYFPLILNQLISSTEFNEESSGGYLNRWLFDLQTHFSAISIFDDQGGMYFNAVLCPQVSWIVETIYSNWGLKIDNTFFTTLENDSLILLSMRLIFLYKPEDMMEPKPIDVRKAMPDMTVREFMGGLKTLFGLAYSYNFAGGKVEVTTYEQVMQDKTYTDITSKVVRMPEPITLEEYSDGVDLTFNHDGGDRAANDRTKLLDGDRPVHDAVVSIDLLPASDEDGALRLVIAEDKYYTWEVNPETLTLEWMYYCDNLVNKRVGNGGKTYEATVTPPLQRKISPLYGEGYEQPHAGDETGLFIKVPWIDQECKSYFMGDDDNTFAGRVAFYRGLQANGFEPGYPYPYASTDVVTYDDEYLGAVSLKWDDINNNGLYDTYWKKFIEFLTNGQAFSSEVQYTVNDLRALNTNKWVRIESTEYLHKKIQVTLENATKTLKPAAVEIYKR
jgi:hypothetical protein